MNDKVVFAFENVCTVFLKEKERFEQKVESAGAGLIASAMSLAEKGNQTARIGQGMPCR